MSDTAPRQRYTVAIPNSDGSETVTPMKTWLRLHPDKVPEGEGDDFRGKHSRYIARRLLAHGWSSQQTPEEFRLFPRDVPPPLPPPDGEDDDEPDSASDSEFGSFRMESELQTFLANNLSLARVG
jgi:hypothetical protein